EAWTYKVYQGAVTSPLWPRLALIWTYDEAGGFADHVPPPNEACVARPDNPKDLPFVELGARVPLAVISPYARPHFVSHVVQDHTAVTRFIETVFGVTALTARDANSDALLDMFDFGCAPALLQPPEAPPAGTGGCFGTIMLTTDHPSYASNAAMVIDVTFSGVRMPATHDRIGIYRYGEVPPNEVNRHEPVAWGYIGGQGHTPAGAPSSGVVTLDQTVLSAGAAWPLTSGIWIAYYMPGNNTVDGHTPIASIDLEVTP